MTFQVGGAAGEDEAGDIGAVQIQEDAVDVDGDAGADGEDEFVRGFKERAAIGINAADEREVGVGGHEHVEVDIDGGAERGAERVGAGHVEDREIAEAVAQGHVGVGIKAGAGETEGAEIRGGLRGRAPTAGDFGERDGRDAAAFGHAGIDIVTARGEGLGVILPIGTGGVADDVIGGVGVESIVEELGPRQFASGGRCLGVSRIAIAGAVIGHDGKVIAAVLEIIHQLHAVQAAVAVGVRSGEIDVGIIGVVNEHAAVEIEFLGFPSEVVGGEGVEIHDRRAAVAGDVRDVDGGVVDGVRGQAGEHEVLAGGAAAGSDGEIGGDERAVQGEVDARGVDLVGRGDGADKGVGIFLELETIGIEIADEDGRGGLADGFDLRRAVGDGVETEVVNETGKGAVEGAAIAEQERAGGAEADREAGRRRAAGERGGGSFGTGVHVHVRAVVGHGEEQPLVGGEGGIEIDAVRAGGADLDLKLGFRVDLEGDAVGGADIGGTIRANGEETRAEIIRAGDKLGLLVPFRHGEGADGAVAELRRVDYFSDGTDASLERTGGEVEGFAVFGDAGSG